MELGGEHCLPFRPVSYPLQAYEVQDEHVSKLTSRAEQMQNHVENAVNRVSSAEHRMREMEGKVEKMEAEHQAEINSLTLEIRKLKGRVSERLNEKLLVRRVYSAFTHRLRNWRENHQIGREAVRRRGGIDARSHSHK